MGRSHCVSLAAGWEVHCSRIMNVEGALHDSGRSRSYVTNRRVDSCMFGR